MSESEKEAIRQRLSALGVNSDWATAQAVRFGDLCLSRKINLQSLLLFALTVASGCRSGLAAELAREVEELHAKVDVETDEQIAAERN